MGRKLKKTRSLVLSVVRLLFLLGISVIILYPLFYSLSIALRPVEDLYDPLVVLIPRHVTLDNLLNVFNRMDYPHALVGSIIRDGISTLLQLFSCSLAAYGLARFKFPGRKLLNALVVLMIIVPPQTYIIPNYIQFRYFDPLYIGHFIGLFTGEALTLNLVNTYWAFFLPALFAMGIRSGLVIFIFRQFFRGMPKELEEAAYIDGCSFVRTFYRIMLPNAKASLVTTFLLSIVWYWNDYVFTSSLTPQSKTVMNQLAILKNNINYIMQYEQNASPYEGILLLQAGVFLSIIPVLILYLIFQRQFTSSIERSGIVG